MHDINDMQYLSTRGGIQPVPFTKAVMMGLAEDGGLLLPRTIPRIDSQTLASWKGLSYTELAFEVMTRFIDKKPLMMLLMSLAGLFSISLFFVPADQIGLIFAINLASMKV